MINDHFVESMLRGLFDDNVDSPIRNSIFAQRILLLYLREPESRDKKIFGIQLRKLKDEDYAELKKLYENLPTLVERQDFRISKILMHGIRGVGFTNNRTYFGLDCTDHNEHPCSMVLIGANGIGKTSFYSALEMIGMGHSNCAHLRGYRSREQQAKFMENVNANASDGHILVKTAQNEIKSLKIDEYGQNQVDDSLISESCFCSDYDIQTLEDYSYNSTKYSFTDYIHSQLGLSGFDLIIPVLNKYNKEIISQASKIRANTEAILRLKNSIFQLQSERAIIDRLNQSISLSTAITKYFLGTET